MKVAAALVSMSLLAGCFPHNEKYRTYAKVGEGASLATGIIIESLIQSGADCNQMQVPGVNMSDSCHTKASALGSVGVILILGGLLGFVATISTSEDDNNAKPVVSQTADQKAQEAKTAAKLTPLPGLPSANTNPAAASGSASPAAPKSAP
jgi:hypothetical protein